MRCFELLELNRQADLCAQAQNYLIELQRALGVRVDIDTQELDTDRYMIFAEAVTALACSLDEATHANSAMSLNVEGLLQLSEERFGELGLDKVVLAKPEVLTPHQAINDVAPLETSDLFEETEDLLGDFDSLLATTDLLELSDNGFVDDEAADPDQSRAADTSNAYDNIDEGIVESFNHEALGLLDEIEIQLDLWRSPNDHAEPIRALQRLLHTLKGSSLVAGYRDIGDLCHGLESILSSIQSGVLPSSSALTESLGQSIASMRDMLHKNPALGEVTTATQEMVSEIPDESLFEVVTAKSENSEDKFQLADKDLSRLFQLNAEELVGQAELFVDVSKAMNIVAELDGTIHRLSTELDESATSTDQRVRLTEAINDLRLATNQVLRHVGNIEARIDGISSATTSIRQSLLEVRMVDLASEASTYQRLVEQTSAQLEKNVVLYVGDSDIKFDRIVLSRISAVLGHLLRNAVDHGIEVEEIRLNAGKPARAVMLMSSAVGAQGITITVADDGAGIDMRRVWRKAVVKKLIGQDEMFSEAKAIDLLFGGSLSTKTQVTHVSGRGVGLNAVRAAMAQLDGTVLVDSEFGRGSSFTLCLPYSAGLIPATIVTVAGQRFALPGKVDSIAIDLSEVTQPLRVAEETYECQHLADLLRIASTQHKTSSAQALLLDYSGSRLALIVDKVEGAEHILLGSAGPQLSDAAYLSGAGLLEEGDLVPVLNPAFLLALAGGPDVTLAANESAIRAVPTLTTQTILVVDDSLTTRRYCEKLLQGNGYDVVVAKSAEEALMIANDINVDLLVSDLQLPGMDGFQLAEGLRQQLHYAALPVVLISASDYNEVQSQQYNIAAWLSKPYRDQELYEVVRRLIGA